jgi:O-antigen/teichoic acid export membrane protein
LLTIVSTFVLARLLSPSDFGIASLGMLFVFLILPLLDVGIAQALVRGKEAELAQRALTAFWLVALLGLLFYAAIFVAADYLAAFFGRSEIAPMLRVICLAVPIYAASRIPSALLEREFRFGSKGLVEVVASVGYVGCAIALALLGFGFWSLVIASLARWVIVSLGAIAIARWRPGLVFDATVAMHLISYARYLMAGSLLRLAYSNLDNLVVGRVVGMTGLGFYAMAYNLGNLAGGQVSEPLGRVLFPSYSRLIEDRERVRVTVLLTLRYASLFISPVTFVGVVMMPELVPAVLGPRWTPIVFSLQVLMFYGWARALAPVYWALMLAADLGKASMRVNFVGLAVAVVAAMPVAYRFGYQGVAVLFSLLELIRLVDLGWQTNRHLHLSGWQQVKSIWPGVAAGAAGASAAAVVQFAWPSTWLFIAVQLAAALVAIVACCFLLGELAPARLRAVMEVVRSGTRRKN